MARNLIPELERLKDESEQDSTWIQRQQSDVGLLKSPWKSPGWKADEQRDRDRAVPELTRKLSDASMFRRRPRAAVPTLTLSQLTSSACSPALPTCLSPSPASRPSRTRPPPAFNFDIADRRGSLDSRTPERTRTRCQTTPPRYTSSFLASPFLPTSQTPGQAGETCPAPRRKRPVSISPVDPMFPLTRPMLARRGISDPLSNRSRPISAAIMEGSDEEDVDVEEVDTPSKVIHRVPTSLNRSRVQEWVEASGSRLEHAEAIEVTEDEDVKMHSDTDSMASGCGEVVETRLAQPRSPREELSASTGSSGSISISVRPCPTVPKKNIFGNGRPLLFHVQSTASTRTTMTADSSGIGDLPSPTPSPGHQGALRGAKAGERPLSSITNLQKPSQFLQPKRPVHTRAITSPLLKTLSWMDQEQDRSIDVDGNEKDGFDLDELNFELESAEVDMEAGYRGDDMFDRALILDDQEDSGLALDAHDPSLVSMWLQDSPSSRKTSSRGLRKNVSSPDLANRVLKPSYTTDQQRDGESPDFFGFSRRNAGSAAVSPKDTSPFQRSSPESPTPSGLASPPCRASMLGDRATMSAMSAMSQRRESLEVPPRDRTSLQEGSLMDQLFPKARQSSFNRPGLPRRTTAPAAAGYADMAFPPIAMKMPSSKRNSMLSNASSASPRPSPSHLPNATPTHAFEGEKPSPAAFMSTGLIKKGSGSFRVGRRERSTTNGPPLPLAVARRPPSLFIDTHSKMPDTPIKQSTHTITTSFMSMEKPKLRPLVLPISSQEQHGPDRPLEKTTIVAPSVSDEHRRGKFSQRGWQRTETSDSIVTIVPNEGSAKAGLAQSRGLRRKGSALWARTTSGNWSNGSWSKQTAPGIDEEEPITPTRPFEHAVTRLDFTGLDTPSPPAPIRTYPFANGPLQSHGVPSPSPPRRKGTLLQRLQGSKHKTLRRISNPLLSAAYKLGEQQAQFGNHMKNLSTDSSKAPKQGRPPLSGSPAVTRFEKDYVMLEPIGNGEFSTVWKVKEKKTGKLWAVKRGKPYLGLKDRKRQLEEVKVMEALARHPNPHVLQFHEAWEEKEQLHIRTTLAECGDLASYLVSVGDTGGLDEGRCWKLLLELTAGLRHIHSLGILHLDLKPGNILITAQGGLQISDFGLSVFKNGDSSRSLGADSPREGDREYLSPEVLCGDFGYAADVFSLGITLLEASFNITLPSNGIAWQKLRSDDFSDLEEHLSNFTPRSDSITAADTSIPLSPSGTSISSESSLSSLEIDLAPARGPSRELLVTIKGMMRSDSVDRWTLQDVWEFPVIRRLQSMSSAERSTRVSIESAARSSLDEWEEWHRQRGHFGMDTSPESARINIPIVQSRRQISPALCPEGADFLDDILRCWQRIYI